MASNEEERINYLTKRPYSEGYFQILETRQKLPVYESKARLLHALEENNVVVLEGETGSGKTTQVPQFLVEAGYASNGKQVCCTQPRRVAAISVARRVAAEMDVKLGRHVGYTVRFDDKTSPETKLRYLTDGMLLREAMADNDFSNYNAIILDEAHERTLSTDILMGVLKTAIQRRTELRVIVMSATLDTDKFRQYFNDAPLLKVPGRVHPVEVYYSQQPETNYIDAAVNASVLICKNEPPGDVLVFLTGEDEIEEVCDRVERTVSREEHIYGRVAVYPLYGSLPPDVQQRVFEPAPGPSYAGGPPGRKIICATNIAETSLTIDGVVYVVDTGLSKQKIYNPRARLESLLVDNISQASAKQRAGRAGRTRKGKCFRLYTKDSFENDLLERSHPEILRSNLCNVVLQMLKLGVKDLVHFDFMDPPAPETMMRALEALNYLGAIDDEANLTDFGDLITAFPLDPEASTALIKSVEYSCSEEVLTICAMLSEAANCFINGGRRGSKRSRRGSNLGRNKDPGHGGGASSSQTTRSQFEYPGSDHITYLNVFDSYMRNEDDGFKWCQRNMINPRALKSASNVRRQLADIMRKNNLQLLSINSDHPKYSESIRKAMLSGYFMQVAHRNSRGGRLRTAKDNEDVRLHATCSISRTAPTVMYHEFVLTARDTMVRTCSEVDAQWLVQIAPHYFDLSNFPNGALKEALRYAHSSKAKRKAARKWKSG